MNTLVVEIDFPYAQDVHVPDVALTLDLSDGRTISVPLGWFPRLEHGRPDERSNGG